MAERTEDTGTIYRIALEDMEFKAFHGCYDLEKIVGNRFVVSVVLHADVSAAAAGDDVSRTVNYLNVYEAVARQMRIKSDIIENVALRIINALFEEFPVLARVEATVSKLAPPLGGKIKKVSVTLALDAARKAE